MKTLKSALAVFLLLLSTSVAAFDIDPVAEGVYAAEAKSPSGETVYLGIESLDTDEARTNWIRYSESASRLVDNPQGYLLKLGTALGKGSVPMSLRDEPAYVDMSDADFNQLVGTMAMRDLYPGAKRWESFNGIRGGIAGFDPYMNATYVAYISKDPITGRLAKPDTNLHTYDGIHAAYSHIVMTVGVSTKPGHPVYEDRGIFRNPISMAEGGYGGVATMLHAFAAYALVGPVAFDHDDLTVEYMMVRALPKMQQILEAQVGKENILYEADADEELKEPLAGFGGLMDTLMIVEIEDLLASVGLDMPKREVAEQPKPAPKPVVKPAVKPKPKPAVKPVAKPKPAPKPVAKPAAQPFKHTIELSKHVAKKIKAKGSVQLIAAEPGAKGGKIVVMFGNKADAHKFAKLVGGKTAAPVHQSDLGYGVKIGPNRLKTLYGKDSGKLYDAVVKELNP